MQNDKYSQPYLDLVHLEVSQYKIKSLREKYIFALEPDADLRVMSELCIELSGAYKAAEITYFESILNKTAEFVRVQRAKGTNDADILRTIEDCAKRNDIADIPSSIYYGFNGEHLSEALSKKWPEEFKKLPYALIFEE